MLLEFSVANYRSINEQCTLSMEAQSISDAPKDNLVNFNKKKLLKSIAIYGANSSGKSNIIQAIDTMKNIVLSSVKLNDDDELFYDPFRLSKDVDAPSYFEVIFINNNNNKYRYGFELTATKIEQEWLLKTSSKKEAPLFIRNNKGIGVDELCFPEGVDKEKNTNDNRLFLSLCGQLGGEISKEVLSWFSQKINIISGIDSQNYLDYSKKMLHENLDKSSEIKEFLRSLKLGFDSLRTQEIEFDENMLPVSMPKGIREDIINVNRGKKSIELFSQHSVYNKSGDKIDVIDFDVEEAESDGTKKLIELSGPIFDTLFNGKVLVIDELDAKMHPNISKYIIRLFNDKKTNFNGAQLIFTTHDTHLLSSKLLRRDQIWFTEKDKKEQTNLYSMMDIILPDGTKPRNDANYERNYIAGRYGAIPFILN